MNIKMKMKQQDEIYWIRVALGIISGLIAGFIGFDSNNSSAAQGILIPIVVYIFTFYVLRLKFKDSVMSPKQIFIKGIGSFIMLFLFSWILYNSLIVI